MRDWKEQLNGIMLVHDDFFLNYCTCDDKMKNTDEKHVKMHWDAQANKDISSDQVTLKDINQRKLEINLICRYLDKRDLLLEIGCGNGFSTSIFSKNVNYIHAIDCSEEMINRAVREFGQMDNVKFEFGDVLNLNFPECMFDSVVVERCLINLSSWEEQKLAIKNIARVLKPGGRFIFVEGIENGLIELNTLRTKMGLNPIITASYNLNFNEDALIKFVKEDFQIMTLHKFGTYDFISRVIHPLMVYPNEPTYDAKINDIAREVCLNISSFDKFSRLIGLILKRKDSSPELR